MKKTTFRLRYVASLNLATLCMCVSLSAFINVSDKSSLGTFAMADVLNETLKEFSQNVTAKPKASSEGMAIAYTSLVVMAIIPIFFGSFRSVKYLKKQKESGEKPETMSHKDAAMFPFIASAALLGLYIFFKVFSKEYINLLVTVYFFGLGVIALTHIISPFVEKLLPESFDINHAIVYSRTEKERTEVLLDFTVSHKYLVTLFMCSLVGAFYIWKKHWVVNNLLGLAFAVNGVELLHLNNIVIGCTLLAGLFIYDIFWVFGTDVMVTVAKSFEAPIKLVFPQDILENWLEGRNFAMLGLGDIVIPGIFIALLLRFDKSLKRDNHLYFYSSLVAYFLGLILTIFIMSVYKHAQPALLYLVPACIGTPLLIAALKGDIVALFKYEDHPTEEEQKEKEGSSEPEVLEDSNAQPADVDRTEIKKEK